MNNVLTVLKHRTLPALLVPSPQAGQRFIEFFTVNIRYPYARSAIKVNS
jgi:hypothetical protein